MYSLSVLVLFWSSLCAVVVTCALISMQDIPYHSVCGCQFILREGAGGALIGTVTQCGVVKCALCCLTWVVGVSPQTLQIRYQPSGLDFHASLANLTASVQHAIS